MLSASLNKTFPSLGKYGEICYSFKPLRCAALKCSDEEFRMNKNVLRVSLNKTFLSFNLALKLSLQNKLVVSLGCQYKHV